MNGFRLDDLIIHRKLSATVWRVLKVNFDGTLEAKFVRGGRLPNRKRMVMTITDPAKPEHTEAYLTLTS